MSAGDLITADDEALLSARHTAKGRMQRALRVQVLR